MIKKLFFLLILFNLAFFTAFAEEKRYFMTIKLLISDNVKKVAANYKFTRITTEGKPIAINLRVSNMQISLAFNLLSGDDASVNLVSFGRVALKMPMPGRPLSDNLPLSSDSAIVSSKVKPSVVLVSIPKKTFPLKFGEKLLFFPLGVKDNGKNGKISNCILEIKVLPYENNDKKLTEESGLLEPSKQPQTEKIDS